MSNPVGKKILVVDDDRAIVQLVGLTLRQQGYEVMTALDSYQALQSAVSQSPDLMILDVNMPAGSGLLLQERLQRIGHLCGKPVIFLTGETSQAVSQKATQGGAAAVLHKPVDLQKLVQAVRGVLGGGAVGAPVHVINV
jgi:two-component system, chemotaxis family, chemotaxis protein CheY